MSVMTGNVRIMTKRLRQERSGVALIEFALLLPILLLFFFGMFELTRLMLFHQKLDKMVNTVTDLVAQNRTLTESQINDLINYSNIIVQPLSLDLATDDLTITAVTVDAARNTRCLWQRSLSGTKNTCGANSPIGPLPKPIADNTIPNQAVIIGVVTYEYTSVTSFLENIAGLPVIGGNGNVSLSGAILTKSAVLAPRLGALTSIAPNP